MGNLEGQERREKLKRKKEVRAEEMKAWRKDQKRWSILHCNEVVFIIDADLGIVI